MVEGLKYGILFFGMVQAWFFSLLLFAKRKKSTAHNITQTLNSYAQKRFYDFVNIYRVNAFQEQVMDPKNQHFSIRAIANDCGFNSKSSFGQVFKD